MKEGGESVRGKRIKIESGKEGRKVRDGCSQAGRSRTKMRIVRRRLKEWKGDIREKIRKRVKKNKNKHLTVPLINIKTDISLTAGSNANVACIYAATGHKQCGIVVNDVKDSQGAELRHVVETGDWNAADVVVVQSAAREGGEEGGRVRGRRTKEGAKTEQ